MASAADALPNATELVLKLVGKLTQFSSSQKIVLFTEILPKELIRCTQAADSLIVVVTNGVVHPRAVAHDVHVVSCVLTGAVVGVGWGGVG